VDEYKPAAQTAQLVESDAPVVVRVRPAAHGVQLVEATIAAYVPALQLAHATNWPDDAENVPTAQLTQLVAAVAPVVGRVVPEGQSVQVVERVEAANDPIQQLEHVAVPPTE
jgi:hypothetical protein